MTIFVVIQSKKRICGLPGYILYIIIIIIILYIYIPGGFLVCQRSKTLLWEKKFKKVIFKSCRHDILLTWRIWRFLQCDL